MKHQSGNDRLRFPSITLAIVACLLLAACEQESPPGTATPIPLSETTLQPADDHSLPNDEYISLGMPSYDREWFGYDMMAAAIVLQDLPADQLPRLQSARSGKVFARIVSPDNLNTFRNQSLSLNISLPISIQYMEASAIILKLYLNHYMEDKTIGEDIISLMGTVLRTSQASVELIEEFIPTISKDDPTYQTRMAGLDTTKRGLANVVAGTMASFAETQSYSLSARLRLIEYSRDTFPSIVPMLSPPSQAEVLHKLDAIVNDPKLRDLHEQLILLRDEVRAATQTYGQQ